MTQLLIMGAYLLLLLGLGLVTNRLFRGTARDYFLATDPIAFWQGVGFWLIIAALAGFLAWRYWQPKLFPAATATPAA